MLERRSAEPFLPSCNKKKEEVRFVSVELREYPIILGDNPSCTAGPPIAIALDWDYDTLTSCTIDEYESMRLQSGKRTRQ